MLISQPGSPSFPNYPVLPNVQVYQQAHSQKHKKKTPKRYFHPKKTLADQQNKHFHQLIQQQILKVQLIPSESEIK
jgi:hypothetical protein